MESFTNYIKKNTLLFVIIGAGLILTSMFAKLLQAIGIIILIMVAIVYLFEGKSRRKGKGKKQ